jgi:hypothetical protein
MNILSQGDPIHKFAACPQQTRPTLLPNIIAKPEVAATTIIRNWLGYLARAVQDNVFDRPLIRAAAGIARKEPR